MDLPLPFSEASAPFVLHRPARQEIPVVFASPHSGRTYPPAFLAAARLDPLALRRSEDGFVDELFAAAPAHGAPLLTATFPRAYCDPNREPWELDPEMFAEPLPPWVNSASPRIGAGLGTIPRIVASGEPIYRERLSFAEAEVRIRSCWGPFHAALFALIKETRAAFGPCLLIDCHSMPALALPPGRRVDFVLGDAHGTTCAGGIVRLVEHVLGDLGYRVRRNDPYSGGYITRHYGRPREDTHALQVEIARDLYMNEERMQRLATFPHMQRNMEALIAALKSAGPCLAGP
ncbi:MAG: N-formylglutamate amidohydrolase [Rhodospirillales bacterium]|nr:N-formylglutamate amidohydrolase [Rhodospirillales bacterium]